MIKNILISGGTGLVGSELVKALEAKGYQVAVLSRSRKAQHVKSFFWDYEQGILEEEAIEFADVIIHLAGENISNKRWSEKQKARIIDSRVKTTELLLSKTKEAKNKPNMIISASAIGYYGSQTSDKIYTESDEPGQDFLAKTVIAWEKSVDEFESIGVKVAKLRLGVVLTQRGGALQKMLAPIKMGFGSAIGSGKQYMPWISLEDLVRMFVFVLETPTAQGVYNAVAPQHINNREMMKTLARQLKEPFFMPPIPMFVFKLIFGEMSTILLDGSRVSSAKIQKQGYEFTISKIEQLFLS